MKEKIEKLAINAIQDKGWKYHECLGARKASQIDNDFVRAAGLFESDPNELWAVPFRMQPPSDTEFTTHNVTVAYVDGTTFECHFCY